MSFLDSCLANLQISFKDFFIFLFWQLQFFALSTNGLFEPSTDYDNVGRKEKVGKKGHVSAVDPKHFMSKTYSSL